MVRPNEIGGRTVKFCLASISVIITRVMRLVKWQFLMQSARLGGPNGFILSPLQRR
jgi:hypothetical protein